MVGQHPSSLIKSSYGPWMGEQRRQIGRWKRRNEEVKGGESINEGFLGSFVCPYCYIILNS